MNNTQTVSELVDEFGSPVRRYRGIIISIAVFLAMVSGLMYYGYILTQQTNKNQVQIDAAGTLSDTLYDLLVTIQSLRLANLEYTAAPDNAEYAANQVENQKLLEKRRSDAQNLINVIDKGGAYDVVEGVDSIDGLSRGTIRQSLSKVQKVWEQYQPLLDSTIKHPVASDFDSDFAKKAAEFAADNHNTLYESIDEIIVYLNEDITEASAKLKIVQMAGIGLSLLYFLFFVNFFIRRLGKADRVAAIARRENREILQTVDSGLFLLDKNLNIGSQYSNELERLWGKKDFAGQNMLSVLSGMVSNPEDLETAGSFVRQLYNSRAKEKLIESLNPLACSPMNITNQSGIKEIRYLDFKFNRVYQDGEIARVLVSVSDVTNAVLLEDKIAKEREQNDLQMEMLSFILNADAQLLADFIESAKKRNNNINEVLKQPVQAQVDFFNKLRAIFREVHGLKGDASSLSLHGFVSIAEYLEDSLRDLQGRKTLNGEDFLTLAVSLEELFNLTQTIEDLNNRINNLTADNGKPSRQAAQRVVSSEPVKGQLSKYVEELAQRNRKKVDFSCEGMDNQAVNLTIRSQLRELAVQLLRNAVVHGIEIPEERIKQHKLDAGHIRLTLEDGGDSVRLTVQDDGAGINPELIRSKLVETGGYSYADAAKLDNRVLIQKIFTPGFSTAADSNEDAGRGVGMDIISNRVKQMKGRLSLATRTGAYTRIILTVPKKP
ncbi:MULTISPECIES: ATP-binding protein [unclassified Neisseria]|uniref:ATP-binding protein n=1 Tax=unclassified Neisseria TaxID=2623750 RepID=UPI001071CDF6|nr:MULTISPECIES: ATP-binding protein [unclassified Neisseria]MBF0804202.1 Hpt domain-containing protein [Neisseria sp. 19428wB4_WF04]TFU43046.1 chemotaxis protein CheA [Neisseria sp. WF04]